MENCLICNDVVIERNAKLQSGTMIDNAVQVNSDVTLPVGTVASCLSITINNMNQISFSKSEKEASSDLFSVGHICHLPNEMQLKTYQEIG